MATQAQIEAALQIQGTYSLITGAASFTDVTNYSGLGIASPDTVKILLWIQDSTTATLYKNAGYDAANFAAPDLQPIAGDETYSYTLPTTTSGAYLQGQYTVNMKVQVVEGGVTTNAFKALYQNVTALCNGIVPVVVPNVTYNTAIVSVTDNTNYKGYTALTNTLTLYPPPQSGQTSQTLTATGAPATLVYQPDPGDYPYTGTWTWTLTSDVTFTSTGGASTTCRITAQGSFEVIQSQLCKVYCVLKEARGEVMLSLANRQTFAQLQLDNLVRAEGEYMLAWAASLCGKPQSEIDVYIANIYALINKDPNCGCGCSDGTSQPLVPTSIINGVDGEDGSKIYNGSGVPNNNLGVVGDYYINTANGDLYEKTGASTWSFVMNIIGPTGATGGVGATGAAGANGVVLLENDLTDDTTSTNSLQTLKSFTMAAGQLATDGDIIDIRARFRATPDKNQKECYVYLDGSSIAGWSMQGDSISGLEVNVKVSRTGATAGKADVEIFVNANFFLGYLTTVRLSSLSSVSVSAWASALDIEIKADDNTGNAITCDLFQIAYYQLGSVNLGGGILYGVPFNTIAATQSYPNIIGQVGKTIRRVYLDGELLDSSDWSYNNVTDTITFIITITATSEVQFDYQ